MTHAILTAIGTDRPGLVEEVSEFIFEHGGNIEDSRMVNLRGQFAMMVLIGVSDAVFAKLKSGLPVLAQKSQLHAELHEAVRSAQQGAGASRAAGATAALPYRLTASAMDQSGLVHRIAHLLRSMQVNIESLETRLSAAPYTGAPVFEMELAIAVPRSTPIATLRERLGALCDELNIDWKLEAF